MVAKGSDKRVVRDWKNKGTTSVVAGTTGSKTSVPPIPSGTIGSYVKGMLEADGIASRSRTAAQVEERRLEVEIVATMVLQAAGIEYSTRTYKGEVRLTADAMLDVSPAAFIKQRKLYKKLKK